MKAAADAPLKAASKITKAATASVTRGAVQGATSGGAASKMKKTKTALQEEAAEKNASKLVKAIKKK